MSVAMDTMDRRSQGRTVTLVPRNQVDQNVGSDLISVPEAARRIGLHADTLYRLCRTGQFPPSVQIGTRWRVSVPKLERFLHSDLEVKTICDVGIHPAAQSRMPY